MPITLQETLEEIFTVLAYILLYSECADGFSRGDTMKVTAALQWRQRRLVVFTGAIWRNRRRIWRRVDGLGAMRLTSGEWVSGWVQLRIRSAISPLGTTNLMRRASTRSVRPPNRCGVTITPSIATLSHCRPHARCCCICQPARLMKADQRAECSASVSSFLTTSVRPISKLTEPSCPPIFQGW